MWKRLIAAAFAAAVMLSLPIPSAAAEQTLRRGDTVKYIFYVDKCDNVAGIAVDSYYNAELLELSGEPEFLIEGQGMKNTSAEGRIKWNIMINGGREFDGEEIFAETFTVRKKCTLEDAALSFTCSEVFGDDLQQRSTKLVQVKTEILETGSDDDSEPPESENVSEKSESSDPVSSEDSRPESESESREAAPSQKASERSSEQTSSIRHIEVIRSQLVNSDDPVDPDEENVRASSRGTTHAPSRTTSRAASGSTSAASSAASSKASSKASSSASASGSVSSIGQTSGTSEISSAEESSSLSSPSAASSSEISSAASQTPKPSASSNRVFIAATAAVIAAAGVSAVLAKVLKTKE